MSSYADSKMRRKGWGFIKLHPGHPHFVFEYEYEYEYGYGPFSQKIDHIPEKRIVSGKGIPFRNLAHGREWERGSTWCDDLKSGMSPLFLWTLCVSDVFEA
jgi:hypothetical protein